jgi:hypothetical protein
VHLGRPVSDGAVARRIDVGLAGGGDALLTRLLLGAT